MPIFTQPRIRGRSYLEEMGTSQTASNRAAAELNIDPVEYLSRIQQLDEAQYGKPVTAPGIFPPIQTGREPVDSPVLSAETARARVTENQLDLTIPDDGIPERALEILIERKRRERVLQDTINRAPQGIGPGAIRFAATLGSSMLDPINIASAFVPVVGAARAASMFAKTSSFMGRVGVRARIGAIEGAVGAAIVEPIVGIGAIQEQSDYNLATILTDLGGGTILGGGLHVAVGAAGDVATRTRFGRAATIARSLDAGELRPAPTGFEPTFATRVADAAPETRQALLRVSVAQMAEGRAVNIDALARLDPVIRGEVPGASAASQPVDINAPDLAAEVAKVVEQAQAAKAAPAENVASVLFMITQAQRAELRARGFTDEAVRNMTPQQAQDALRTAQTADAGTAAPKVQEPAGTAPAASPEVVARVREMAQRDFPNASPEEIDRAIAAAQASPSAPRSPRPITYTRPSDRPVSLQAWAELQSNARLGAVAESTLADTVAAREADELLKARAGKDDDDIDFIQQETDDILAEIGGLARGFDDLPAGVRASEASGPLPAGIPAGAEGPFFHGTTAPVDRLDLSRARKEPAIFLTKGEATARLYAGPPAADRFGTASADTVSGGRVKKQWRVFDRTLGGQAAWVGESFSTEAKAVAKATELSAGAERTPDGKVLRAYLTPRNPKEIEVEDFWQPEQVRAAVDAARAEGHDLLILRGYGVDLAGEWAVLDPAIIHYPTVMPGAATAKTAATGSVFPEMLEADALIANADIYGRAAEAMANCQLRRGVL